LKRGGSDGGSTKGEDCIDTTMSCVNIWDTTLNLYTP